MRNYIFLIMKISLLIVIFFSCKKLYVKKLDKPNFIIFIADDISWNDFGCYGNQFVQTPTRF